MVTVLNSAQCKDADAKHLRDCTVTLRQISPSKLIVVRHKLFFWAVKTGYLLIQGTVCVSGLTTAYHLTEKL